MLVLSRKPYPEISVERSGDLRGEEVPDAAVGDPADQLADQEALGERVIADRGSRLPLRSGRREPVGRRGPVVELGHPALPVRQSRGVRQHVPDQHSLLACRCELRPVPGHRGVRVQQPAVHQDQRAQRGHRLGHREDVDDRVALPGSGVVCVRVAAPDVDHRLARDEHCRRPAGVTRVQRIAQRLCHRREPLIAFTLDLGHLAIESATKVLCNWFGCSIHGHDQHCGGSHPPPRRATLPVAGLGATLGSRVTAAGPSFGRSGRPEAALRRWCSASPDGSRTAPGSRWHESGAVSIRRSGQRTTRTVVTVVWVPTRVPMFHQVYWLMDCLKVTPSAHWFFPIRLNRMSPPAGRRGAGAA